MTLFNDCQRKATLHKANGGIGIDSDRNGSIKVPPFITSFLLPGIVSVIVLPLSIVVLSV